MGQLCDGGASLQCRYHGLRFNGEGQCVFNPHGGGVIPKAAVVKSYFVVERYSAIWIWMGDPDSANDRKIPDMSFLDPQDWAVGTGKMDIDAPYELEIDNILDLSCNTRSVSLWRTITPSAIIKGSETACCSHSPVLAILTPTSIGASVSEGFSAIITAPRPDEFHCYFWTIRSSRNLRRPEHS
jgi:hypothetical protein